MESIQTARGILADTEKALRELMQQEIEEHRYSDIAELAVLADGVARLLRGNHPERSQAPIPSGDASRRARPKAVRRSSTSRKAYPRFERAGTRLIKVGWSKKAREEYEHRAPRDVVTAFVKYLGSKVEPGATFAVEDLLPVPDSTGGEIPAYQVYMVLAWLRQTGVVDKRGRDGYVVVEPGLDENAFAALWDHIPNRKV